VLKPDLFSLSCDRNYVRIVGSNVRRSGEDMLRKTREGAENIGAEAGSATEGEACDWCACAYWH